MIAHCIFYGNRYSYSSVITLQKEFKKHNVKLKCEEFLKGNNSSKAIHSDIQNYLNYIDNTLQMASLTYPLNSSWEKYCEDNSISYLHPLQIP